jgi:hypothetical protein
MFDTAGNAVTGSAATASGSYTVDTTAPTNTFTQAVYDAATNTFTLTGTNITSINGGTGNLDKNQFNWDNFSMVLKSGDSAQTFTAADIQSMTAVSDTRLTIKLENTRAARLEGNSEFRTGVSGGFDMFNISAGFTHDAAGNEATTDARSGSLGIDLGTTNGWLINPVSVDGNQAFYVWDKNANGTHDSSDKSSFNALETGLMGKTLNTVTETTASRTFSVNGVSLLLPTDGNIEATTHVNPGTLVGGTDFSDGRDIYTPGQSVAGTNAYGWYAARGTAVGSATASDGSTAANTAYNDLLAVWDAYNGNDTNSSQFNGSGWGSLLKGAPPGWALGPPYWSATPSGSSGQGRAFVTLDSGVVFDNAVNNTGNVAFQVL